MRPLPLPLPDNPIPWLTERFRDAGCFDEADEVTRLALYQGAIQSTVNAMSDNAKPYLVKYSAEHGSAYTDGKSQTVVIGTKPLLDPRLNDGQRAALTLALAGHEVGHVRWSVTMQDRLEKHYAGNPHKAAWAAQTFNIVHDIHLEHWQRVDFPPMVEALRLKALYFGAPWTVDLSTPQNRYGALIQATLYPHASDWSDPEAAAFLAWATDWAQRCTAKSARQAKGAIALIEEALDKMRYDETPEPPPEDKPKSTPESEDEDEDPDTEPEEGEDDEGTGTSSEDEGDEDEDDDEAGSSAPPEKTDDEDEDSGTSEGGESDEDDEDWRDEDTGSGAPPEKSDGETVEPEDEAEDGTDEGDGGSPTDTDEDMTLDPSKVEGPERAPTLHGEMHLADDADWQEAIDSMRRTQAAGKDRFVVGDGERFAYREVRISRIQK